MKEPTCNRCGQPIRLEDEAWNFTAHKDSGARWWHTRCPDRMTGTTR